MHTVRIDVWELNLMYEIFITITKWVPHIYDGAVILVVVHERTLIERRLAKRALFHAAIKYLGRIPEAFYLSLKRYLK